MITKKSNENLVIQQLNENFKQINIAPYISIRVEKQIDSMIKKAKSIYSQYTVVRGELGVRQHTTT